MGGELILCKRTASKLKDKKRAEKKWEERVFGLYHVCLSSVRVTKHTYREATNTLCSDESESWLLGMLFSTPTSRSGSDLSKKEAMYAFVSSLRDLPFQILSRSSFSERLSLHALHNGHSNRKWVTSAKENVVVSLDDELPTSPPRRAPPVPEDKLHRVRRSSSPNEISRFVSSTT